MISRGDLLEDVWGYDRRMQTRAVDIAVARVRKHIEIDPRRPQRLLSVRGEGYRWMPDESERAEASPAEATHKTNLRPPLLPLIGRRDEQEKLHAHLDGDTRLLILWGQGGAGKTRLAIECGLKRLSVHPGGVWFCDLSESRDRDDIIRTVGLALGAPMLGPQPEAQLSQVLSARPPMLLILDNMEQLQPHAQSTVGAWAQAHPDHRFLITSRTQLGLPGEQRLALGPLEARDGAQLLRDRAIEARPTLRLDDDSESTITSIVQQLEGHSLAIELAAARAAVMSLEDLDLRLRDSLQLLRRPGRRTGARQDALHDTIRWSWDLLEDWEQRTLAQCSVFCSGFTLRAADEVVALPPVPPAVETIDIIQSLCAHSLLGVHESLDQQIRFTVPRAVREFARSTVDDSLDWEDLQRRHARHYAQMGEIDWLREVDDSSHPHRRSSVALELENIRSAAQFSLEHGPTECAIACTLALSMQVELSGPFPLGLHTLKRALTLEIAPLERCALLRRQAWLQQRSGARTEAMETCAALLDLARSQSNSELIGMVLNDMAYIHQRSGDLERAEALYTEALETVRSSGSTRAEGHVLGNHAILLDHQGKPEASEAAYRAALTRHIEHHNRRAEGHVRGNLGIFLIRQGRYTEAQTLCEAALDIHRSTGNRPLQGNLLSALGSLTLRGGAIDAARSHFQEALDIQRSLGNQRAIGLLLGNLGHLELHHGSAERAQLLLEEAIAIGDQTWPVSAGASRGTLAELSASRGELDRAWTLLEEAEPLLRGVHQLQLAMLLCTRSRVARMRGDAHAADDAREEAQQIAEQLQVGPGSALDDALTTLTTDGGVQFATNDTEV